VLLNTESKVSGVTEIALLQFVFLDLETAFKDFLSLQSQHPVSIKTAEKYYC
jgi:hypothetical protein